ncbi:putative intein containing helicase/endonuclease protein [Bacillus phage Bp8p-C]|uniref:Putative intein containing helicase/endonuclease protein n=2 Tax=Agatevirus Bp8pC TaxID=1910937 RepID=A0A0A0PJ74_9CAUD|nr:DNA helicase [Bacillus phage Bp8p-C]YP_009784398.1 putative intein containing helicase/endonuclease protein [Bacillus phage Bp8p-T]AHJ87528.1 putative intein containing helicase/endonuclease protein [Bacillus phage Bp8p-C]AHJ87739.1 putative intein containing helicase/endonuclease protein [Bacillus phage Bp8p-T]
MKIKIGTMYTYIDFEGKVSLRDKIRDMAHTTLGIKEENSHYSRAYMSGHWDGITDFYDFKEDKFHTGLIDQFLEGLRALQEKDLSVEYEIVDERPSPLLNAEAIDEEIVLGNGDDEPITLREYQHKAVKEAIQEQVGIINIATNGGKCLHPSSILMTSEGLMTVEEFFNAAGHQLSAEERVVDYFGDISLVNRHGELETPSHLTFNGVRDLLEIKGHRGTVNRVTRNHPLLVVSSSGDFEWKKAEDIRIGDYLVGSIGDEVFGSNTLVNCQEAYAIGAIIADGYLGSNERIDFTSNKPEVMERVKKYLLAIQDKEQPTLYENNKQQGAEQVRMHNKKATKAWHDKFKIKYGVAKDKHVPSCILQAPSKVQLAFLSGYLESECSITKSKGNLDVTSASHTLIQQVSLMLRNFGYTPTVTSKKVKGYEQNNYYVLSLGVQDSKHLLKRLDFISSQRVQQVDGFFKATEGRGTVSSKQTVPFGKELTESYIKTLEGKKPRFSVPTSISKERLRNFVMEHPNSTQDGMYETILKLTSPRFVYEQVTEVQSLGKQPTFDVAMPKTHSFVADGIINHNTEVASGVIQQILPYLKRGERIAFFTHSKEIFSQSAERIGKRIGLKARDIGFVGNGKFDIKRKQLVFVMVPTLVSALKDPKKGVKFTHKERVIKTIAEDIVPKFKNTQNTRQLIRNYIKNNSQTTKVWQDIETHLTYVAYDKKFTDKSAQMHLNKYIVEFEKIMEKKSDKKYKKYKETQDFLDSIKVMIADEVHHSKAVTWFESLSLCENAIYRVGLTGTVDKKDKMGYQRLQALFNRIITKVSNDFLIKEGISSKPTIRIIPITEPRNIELVDNFLEAYKLGIVNNEYRNRAVVDLAVAYKKRRPGGILISVKEIEHGETILEMLRDRGLEVEFINGGSEVDHRANQLLRFSQGELPILIASTIIDEGVDMKSIGCMILAAGGKSMRQQLQRIGRGLRLNGIDGNSVMVFDFKDQTNQYLLNHSKERKKIFLEEKFDVKDMDTKKKA